MSKSQAYAIEVHGRSAGIVVAARGGFMDGRSPDKRRVFAAERAFQSLERRVFQQVGHAESAAHRLLTEHDQRHRH